jgi:hypothetical protein
MAIAFGSHQGAMAQITPGIPAQPDLIAQGTAEETGTVDPITPRYQLGKELYLENCASCHVPLPPEVLPSETWRRLLLEPEQHFGQQLKPLIGPVLITMWDYIRAYSRPEEAKKPLPYRISESPYFKALHPRVKFSQTVKTCKLRDLSPWVRLNITTVVLLQMGKLTLKIKITWCLYLATSRFSGDSIRICQGTI